MWLQLLGMDLNHEWQTKCKSSVDFLEGTVASSKLANGRPSPTKSRKPQNFDPKYDQSPFPNILKVLELVREAGGLSQYLEPAKDRF